MRCRWLCTGAYIKKDIGEYGASVVSKLYGASAVSKLYGASVVSKLHKEIQKKTLLY